MRRLGLVAESVIDDFEEPFKEYQALQFQINRRFANGWAVYNNLTLSKLETTGSGAWWNNTSSSYGEDLGVLLTQGMIDECNLQQLPNGDATAGPRFIPMNCTARAQPDSSAQPVSTINRDGRDGLGGGTGAGDGFYGSGVDRPYIWKTFGFKQWNFGHGSILNVGGLLTDPGRRRVGPWRAGRGRLGRQPDRYRVHPAREERRTASRSRSTIST